MWKLFQISKLQRPNRHICLSSTWHRHAAPVDKNDTWKQVWMNCKLHSCCTANNRSSSDSLLDYKTWDSVNARQDHQSIIHQGCAILTEMLTQSESLQQPAVNNSSRQFWIHSVNGMLCMHLMVTRQLLIQPTWPLSRENLKEIQKCVQLNGEKWLIHALGVCVSRSKHTQLFI